MQIDDLTRTILPLDYFREVLGIQPYHFWQLTTTRHRFEGCSSVYSHERWLSDHGPGRNDFIMAINAAEAMLANVLGYQVGPMYSEETIDLALPKVFGYKHKTAWQHINVVGKLTYTTLSAAVAPNYNNPADWVTLSVNVGNVSACEVIVCYPGTFVEIRPIDVTVASGTATIKIRRWLLGNPANWENGDAHDADVAGNMLATVDVLRKWYDVTQQANLLWEPSISDCGCLEPGCAICSLSSVTACVTEADYAEGIVDCRPASYDSEQGKYVAVTALPQYRRPDMVRINYYHGLLDGCWMPVAWRKTVTVLAVSMLDSGVCGCADVVNAVQYWQRDLNESTPSGTFMLGQSEMEGAFGKKRGALHAWNAVKLAIGA